MFKPLIATGQSFWCSRDSIGGENFFSKKKVGGNFFYYNIFKTIKISIFNKEISEMKN